MCVRFCRRYFHCPASRTSLVGPSDSLRCHLQPGIDQVSRDHRGAAGTVDQHETYATHRRSDVRSRTKLTCQSYDLAERAPSDHPNLWYPMTRAILEQVPNSLFIKNTSAMTGWRYFMVLPKCMKA